jgi:predicted TIM-barrel fold metal-dependent hydrolase
LTLQDEHEVDLDAPLIVVTTDSHIGPRLKEDLRQYCPARYLEEFDDFARAVEPNSDPTEIYKTFKQLKGDQPASASDRERAKGYELSYAALMRNATPGHYDVHERLKDMDRNGVVAEVVFHGSQNGQCFPFLNPTGGTFNALIFGPLGRTARELELAAVGQRMYNRWLADQCSVQPERHAGLAHLPMWDVDAAVGEVAWAYDAGLRAVNFPAPKPGMRPYDDLAWEPFWAACAERRMALSTHDGAGFDDISVARPHTLIASLLEGDLVRKLFPRMLFGGMFERYPALRLVLTELQLPASAWWTQTARRYDDLWEANRTRLGDQVPRPPSRYLADNVFLGHSLLHALPVEVELAVRDGYASNFMWGDDYPHQEGVYRHTEEGEVGETRTRLGIRNALSAAPHEIATEVVGGTAVAVYGFERQKLQTVAERIGAMTLRQVGRPLESVPEEWGILSRTQNVFPEYHQGTSSAA